MSFDNNFFNAQNNGQYVVIRGDEWFPSQKNWDEPKAYYESYRSQTTKSSNKLTEEEQAENYVVIFIVGFIMLLILFFFYVIKNACKEQKRRKRTNYAWTCKFNLKIIAQQVPKNFLQ